MNTTSKSKKFVTITQFHDFDFRDSVKVATSNSNEANGLYNYLTSSSNHCTSLTIDGTTPVPPDSRILVKDLQGISAQYNGIWIYSSVSQWTRADDFDNADEIRKGVVVPVELGQKNAATQWVVGNMTDAGNSNPTVWTSETQIKFTDIVSRDLAALPERAVDTNPNNPHPDNVVFLHEENTCTGYEAYQGSFVSLMISQANSQGGGSGLIVDNGHFGVNVDGNVLVIKSKDNTGDGDPPDGDVRDNYDNAYNSNQNIIRISNSSIKNKKLHTPFISLSDGSNGGSVSLGHTLHISGVTDTGFNCNVTNSTFTLSNSKATHTELGVAKFSSTNFSVSNGLVSIKNEGVSNNNLVNPGISLSDGINISGSLSLGQTLIISGNTDTGLNCSFDGTNTFALSNSKATDTNLGVAKFSNTNFSVSNGLVSIKNEGVSNNNLVSSGITFSGGNGDETINLGETLNISLNSLSDGISVINNNLNIITVSSGTIPDSNSITISNLFYTISSGANNPSLGIMLNGSKYYITLNGL